MTYRTTVSLDDRHEEQISEIQDQSDDDDVGVSEAVRELLDRAREVDEIRHERDELRNRVDELRNQLAMANTRIDQVNDLVAYVDRERSLMDKREWRERKKAHAGLLPRVKWKLTGMPEPPSDPELSEPQQG